MLIAISMPVPASPNEGPGFTGARSASPGLFANSGDAQSYAEDYSLKDWWVTEVISPAGFAESQVATASKALPFVPINRLRRQEGGAQTQIIVSVAPEAGLRPKSTRSLMRSRSGSA